MNIGIVCYPTFGGSGVVATELGLALAKNGHQVHFISYSQPARLEPFQENLLYHEVIIPNYPLFQYPPYELALASRLVDVAAYEKLDLLHVHYAIPHASAAYMAQQILRDQGFNLPFVTTLHGTDITLVGREASYKPVVEFSINHSTAVTAVSESLRKDTLEHFNISKEIHVVPNFYDPARVDIKPRPHFRKAIAPNGEKILVHTSNFRRVKRVQDVVQIFERIRKVIPSKLLLVGDGPERPAIEQLCRTLDSCPDIRFLGKQEAVDEILTVADLFLLPSEAESFGLAALEAMASGVPVVSSNTGGLPEVNIHGVTGFMANIGDVDTMAQHSLDLLQDAKKLDQFRINARREAERFRMDKVLPLYEKVYAVTLDSAKRKGK